MTLKERDGGAEEESPASRGGPGRDPNKGFSPRRASTEEGEKDKDMTDGGAVHGKWY